MDISFLLPRNNWDVGTVSIFGRMRGMLSLYSEFMYMYLLEGVDVGNGANKLLLFFQYSMQSLTIMKTIWWLIVAIIISLTTIVTIARHKQIYSMLEAVMHFNIVLVVLFPKHIMRRVECVVAQVKYFCKPHVLRGAMGCMLFGSHHVSVVH